MILISLKNYESKFYRPDYDLMHIITYSSTLQNTSGFATTHVVVSARYPITHYF